ncbi:YggT family protein [Gemella sp. GH3]|uniref:YggT family protein n=1 Tax=unclassified Gemella TaxID=2624949 RepID=UPI0015D07D47|nr:MULTISPECIES: YggT family protein [unclassified Gemella]MBF0713622.1 YggT family protein [Gemella sp. GH3.1]NYS50574.1 YggT family protein [Gemella sp. GH3]
MLDSSFLIWLYTFIKYLFRIYEGSLIIYILSSWFPISRDNFILKFLEDICEPYLKIFRKILPPVAMIDFSPIIAIIALGFIERIIYSIIFGVSLF